MDRFVNQFSEIGKLNAVMLHRPGDELNQVTPDFFDDILNSTIRSIFPRRSGITTALPKSYAKTAQPYIILKTFSAKLLRTIN